LLPQTLLPLQLTHWMLLLLLLLLPPPLLL